VSDSCQGGGGVRNVSKIRIIEKLNAVQEYPPSLELRRTGKKSLLRQKELLQELFDSVLYKV